MLPNAKKYLISGGFSPRAASYLLIALFLGGVVGIQILSRALHSFIPTHIVDCGHTHEEEAFEGLEEMEEHRSEPVLDSHQEQQVPKVTFTMDGESEQTPLLGAGNDSDSSNQHRSMTSQSNQESSVGLLSANGFTSALKSPGSRRPSMIPRSLTRTLTKITSPKLACDETGPCKGYSDPCGHDCFRAATRRSSVASVSGSRPLAYARSPTFFGSLNIAQPVVEEDEEHDSPTRTRTRSNTGASAHSPRQFSRSSTGHNHHQQQHHHHDHQQPSQPKHDHQTSHSPSDTVAEHHHHVPQNAFLSIGLQTSLAIALHKAPEGFITYATNHANPQLGFAVFMALFIHNITEGFAMALPLYLALQSRLKAILWSSVLGGVSQPLGAGIAAIWFKLASGRNGLGKPSEDVYGCMFAITAGVMASVALQLFSESLGLTHNKTVCIGFAFLGMGILGLSSALTA